MRKFRSFLDFVGLISLISFTYLFVTPVFNRYGFNMKVTIALVIAFFAQFSVVLFDIRRKQRQDYETTRLFMVYLGVIALVCLTITKFFKQVVNVNQEPKAVMFVMIIIFASMILSGLIDLIYIMQARTDEDEDEYDVYDENHEDEDLQDHDSLDDYPTEDELLEREANEDNVDDQMNDEDNEIVQHEIETSDEDGRDSELHEQETSESVDDHEDDGHGETVRRSPIAPAGSPLVRTAPRKVGDNSKSYNIKDMK